MGSNWMSLSPTDLDQHRRGPSSRRTPLPPAFLGAQAEYGNGYARAFESLIRLPEKTIVQHGQFGVNAVVIKQPVGKSFKSRQRLCFRVPNGVFIPQRKIASTECARRGPPMARLFHGNGIGFRPLAQPRAIAQDHGFIEDPQEGRFYSKNMGKRRSWLLWKRLGADWSKYFRKWFCKKYIFCTTGGIPGIDTLHCRFFQAF